MSIINCNVIIAHLPLFESPVAYESMATRGVMPNAAAVSAEATAIAANSSLVGAELIAQSPYTSTFPGRHMKNTLETTGIPGSVCSPTSQAANILSKLASCEPLESTHCIVAYFKKDVPHGNFFKIEEY